MLPGKYLLWYFLQIWSIFTNQKSKNCLEYQKMFQIKVGHRQAENLHLLRYRMKKIEAFF